MTSSTRPIPNNAKDLIDLSNRLSTQMAQRYMNIVRLAKLPMDPSAQSNSATADVDGATITRPDRNEVAVNALTMDIEVATLSATAQELLSLTRRLKEMWLFGELRTLDQGKSLRQTEEDAAVVARILTDMEREQSERFSAAGVVVPGAANEDEQT